jgi:hypothetical protein
LGHPPTPSCPSHPQAASRVSHRRVGHSPTASSAHASSAHASSAHASSAHASSARQRASTPARQHASTPARDFAFAFEPTFATGRHLGRPWKKLEKRRAKEAKEGAPLASSRHEREFVPGLLKLFLATLRRAEALGPEEAGVRSLARLLERLLELFIDLMARLAL